MKITGLITEYNPFHNGHLYHLSKSRELTGADYTVVVMSGDFLQRGTPAIINKYERAKMALSCGADLVLELPAAYACASAEYFAFGGVSLLDGLGCVNDLVFGSETEDMEVLRKAADLLAAESEEFQTALKGYLAQGLTFPQARAEALKQCSGSDGSDLISSPNNILGLEYLKALKRLGSPIQALNLKRQGKGYHDASIADSTDFASATGIRQALEQGDSLEKLKNSMPEEVLKILTQASEVCFPLFEEDFSALVHYKLLLAKGNYDMYADITGDLASRMEKFLPEYRSLGSFTDLLKSRNYTRTRISRCLMHLLLEMKSSNVIPQTAPYARILGFRKESSAVLSEIRKNARIPLITKVADAEKTLADWYADDTQELNRAMMMFDKDLFAADVYETVVSQKFGTGPVNEYTHGVIIL